jgi:twitching motility protein PilI
MVDEVLGMQHFSELSLIPHSPDDSEPDIAPFIQGRFLREQAWQVFSPRALLQSPGFMDVAL